MRQILTILLFISYSVAKASTVDTIRVYSHAMQKSQKCVVIKPGAYKNEALSFPVVYLLHGYGGWYSNWLIRVPQLEEYADRYNMIIVCPDGGKSSWYFDSPVDASMRYETYIGREVPAYIDSQYRTIRDRRARAITGLSMGGHGALFIGFRNAGLFGACGSMSGGVDINASRNKYDLAQRIGDTITHAANWKNLAVINVIEHYPGDSIAIIIDCGTEDFFYPINRQLHEKMLRLNIPHDYTERPGMHDWNYWRNAVKYQLLYFSDFFKSR